MAITGDDKRIGPNQPLMCTVTLHNFISEAAFKKEILLKAAAAEQQKKRNSNQTDRHFNQLRNHA